MRIRNKHINTGLKGFLDYLKGKMSKREQHHFEKMVMSDPFNADAFDGLSKLTADELENDIAVLENRLNKPKTKRNIRLWLYSAASVILLSGLVSILFWIIPPVRENKLAAGKSDEKQTGFTTPLYYEDTLDLSGSELEQPERNNTEKLVDTNAIIKKQQTSIFIDTKKEETSEMMAIESDDDINADNEISKPARNRVVSSKHSEPGANIVTIRGVNSLTKEEKDGISIPVTLQGKVNGVKVSMDKVNTGALIVKGYVMDNLQQPLPGASIVHNKSKKTTVTNIKGYFEITIPAEEVTTDKLTASFIGYDNYEFEARKDTAKIVLNPNLLAMEEIVVVGYGSKKTTINTGASKTISTSENFANNTIQAKPLIGIPGFKKSIIEKLKKIDFQGISDYRITIVIYVNTEGIVDEVTVTKTPDKNKNPEVIKIIKEASVWQPSIENGLPKRDKLQMSFRVKN